MDTFVLFDADYIDEVMPHSYVRHYFDAYKS